MSKRYFFSVVDPKTGRVYRGYRYADGMKAARAKVRADYGKVTFVRLEEA